MRSNRLSPKPKPPPDGMMYDGRGRLVPIEKVEIAAKMAMIGYGKESRSHWSKDCSYDWADKVRKHNGRI